MPTLRVSVLVGLVLAVGVQQVEADKGKTLQGEDETVKELSPAEKHLDLGHKYRAAGEYEQAKKACIEAWRLGEPRGLFCLLLVYATQGKSEHATRVGIQLLTELAKRKMSDSKFAHKIRSQLGVLNRSTVREDYLERRNPLVNLYTLIEYPDRYEMRIMLTNKADEEFDYKGVRAPQLVGRTEKPVMLWDDPAKASALEPEDYITGTLIIRRQGSLPLPSLSGTQFAFHGKAGKAGKVDNVGKIGLIGKVTVVTTRWRKAPDERIKHVSVLVRGIYGASWIKNGVDSSAPSSITNLQGFSTVLQKGIYPYLALETDLTIGETGDATFTNIDFNDQRGDVTRSAVLLRWRGAGVLRTGKENVVSFRLGVGAQFVKYQSQMNTEIGSTIAGPGENVDVDLLFFCGLRYRRRLGKHWTLGMDGSLNATVGQTPKAIEAGLHLGYGFKP